MADRLISADKAKEVLTKLLYETALNNSGGASLMCEDIAEYRLEKWFGLVPTVDAVEVVRCKDCKWWKTNYSWDGSERKVCVIEPYEPVRNEDDFCSRGERKEDGKTD